MSNKAGAKEKKAKQAEEAKRAEEAEKKAKKEAEQAAKERARIEAEEAKEKAKREAEEAKRAEEAEKKAKREAEQAAKERARIEAEEAKERTRREAEERAKREAEKKVSAELYEGMVKLVIASPVDYEQMRKWEEYLHQVQNLHLVLVGSSVEEGTKVVISAEKPIPLISILREMPLVEQVVKLGKEIQVTLKAKR